MHKAIQFNHHNHPFLFLGARKATLKHQLLHVEQGLVLVRLGKIEYAIQPGEYFWIPANCLSAISVFPNSSINCLELSQRLVDSFPNQSGFIKPSDLLAASFFKLSLNPANVEQVHALFSVLRFEALELKPKLTSNETSKRINQWTPENRGVEGLSAEIQLTLLVRSAEKLRKSGKKDNAICNELFSGDLNWFKESRGSIIGE